MLNACSEQRQPVAWREPGADTPLRGLQAFDCSGSIAGGVSCKPASGSAGQASGVLIGGQGTYLQIATSNVSYDSGLEIFQFDLTVQNLMNEAIGTPDGTTPDPEGIQVFFHEGPIVTGGEGEMTVPEPDGTGTFTGAVQPYYAYHEILAKDQVSGAKTWKLGMPPSVASFTFRLYVETDVQYLLVINEVMVNPNGATTSEQPLEWFELYNAGTRPVQLQGLVIADSAASGRRPYHKIASSLVIPSGGYAVLGGSTSIADNGEAPVDYSYGTALNQLANSLDAVKVSRLVGPEPTPDTVTVDRTQYSNASVSAKEGISRELKNPALDNSNMDGSNWDDAAVTAVYGTGGRGTPGAQNSTYVP